MIPWRKFSLGRNFTAPHFIQYFFLRLLPFPRVRHLGSWVIARLVALKHRPYAQPAPDTKTQEALLQLEQCGLVRMAPVLKVEQIDDILRYLVHQPAYDGGRELFATAETRTALRAQYRLETILRCPHVLPAINSPEVLQVAQGFLGCKPTISAVGLHWSFPSERTPADVQMFHRDCEAWRLLNMFIYLTDVDEGGGPHRFVFGSHRTRGRLRLTAYSDAHVYERYGKHNVNTIVGPRGTTFVENGWGIHKGQPPIDKARLMLAVMYSVGPIPVYDYKRVRLKVAHSFDEYINRLLMAA